MYRALSSSKHIYGRAHSERWGSNRGSNRSLSLVEYRALSFSKHIYGCAHGGFEPCFEPIFVARGVSCSSARAESSALQQRSGCAQWLRTRKESSNRFVFSFVFDYFALPFNEQTLKGNRLQLITLIYI